MGVWVWVCLALFLSLTLSLSLSLSLSTPIPPSVSLPPSLPPSGSVFVVERRTFFLVQCSFTVKSQHQRITSKPKNISCDVFVNDSSITITSLRNGRMVLITTKFVNNLISIWESYIKCVCVSVCLCVCVSVYLSVSLFVFSVYIFIWLC